MDAACLFKSHPNKPLHKNERTHNLTEAWSISELILHMRMPTYKPFIVIRMWQDVGFPCSARFRLLLRRGWRRRWWCWVEPNLPILSGGLPRSSTAIRLPPILRSQLSIRRSRRRPIARMLAIQGATRFQIRLHHGLFGSRRSDGDDLTGIAGVRLAGELGFEACSLCPGGCRYFRGRLRGVRSRWPWAGTGALRGVGARHFLRRATAALLGRDAVQIRSLPLSISDQMSGGFRVFRVSLCTFLGFWQKDECISVGKRESEVGISVGETPKGDN